MEASNRKTLDLDLDLEHTESLYLVDHHIRMRIEHDPRLSGVLVNSKQFFNVYCSSDSSLKSCYSLNSALPPYDARFQTTRGAQWTGINEFEKSRTGLNVWESPGTVIFWQWVAGPKCTDRSVVPVTLEEDAEESLRKSAHTPYGFMMLVRAHLSFLSVVIPACGCHNLQQEIRLESHHARHLVDVSASAKWRDTFFDANFSLTFLT